MTAVLLAIGLVLHNNLLNLWPQFTRWLYVPLNAALGVALMGLALGPLGLTNASLGLEGPHLTGFIAGVAGGGVVTAPLFLALVTGRGAIVADRRIPSDDPRQVAWRALVRIPVGTAFLEEMAFRGVLFALFGGDPAAAALSSLTFGLWHITPTLNALRINRQETRGLPALRVVASAVVLTTAAGLVLVWVRVQTGTLAAPFALHAATNSLATIAAFQANRQRAVD